MEEAIRLDPNYADAHLTQGKLYHLLGDAAIERPERAFLAARACQEQALRLNPDLAEAHQILGSLHATLDLDWASRRSHGGERSSCAAIR